MAKISGAGLFAKFVLPHLRKWMKHGKAPRGVYAGRVYKMPKLRLKEVKYTKRTDAAREALRKTFDSSGRSNFLKQLDEGQLRAHGFDAADIAHIKGGGVPDGYQVHHILPLDDGGTNDFSNLILIKNTPDHTLVTNHQKYTVGDLKPDQSRTVPWPFYPEGVSIWPPSGKGATLYP